MTAQSATSVDLMYFCGLNEGLVEDDSIKELRKQFAIVRPICFSLRRQPPDNPII